MVTIMTVKTLTKTIQPMKYKMNMSFNCVDLDIFSLTSDEFYLANEHDDISITHSFIPTTNAGTEAVGVIKENPRRYYVSGHVILDQGAYICSCAQLYIEKLPIPETILITYGIYNSR